MITIVKQTTYSLPSETQSDFSLFFLGERNRNGVYNQNFVVGVNSTKTTNCNRTGELKVMFWK
jgi:hypothetical protein